MNFPRTVKRLSRLQQTFSAILGSFGFTGKLNKLTLKIERPKLTPEDKKKLMEAQRNNKASE
jgi:hypothetical protein